MRTVVHLSDLHFGAADSEITVAVTECIEGLRPDVIAVSGDLTQRARRSQFVAAKMFLNTLPHPQVVVPGNHDVPLYNVLARFWNPLGRFRRYITEERLPVFSDTEVALVGADTTKSLAIKDGGLRRTDLAALAAALQRAGDVVKSVVCHHPFDPSSGRRAARVARRTPGVDAINALVHSGADMVLTGHLHVSYAGHTAMRYQASGWSAIVVEAGTATSTRLRREANAFNVLRIERNLVTVVRFSWDAAGRRFLPQHSDTFARSEHGSTHVLR